MKKNRSLLLLPAALLVLIAGCSGKGKKPPATLSEGGAVEYEADPMMKFFSSDRPGKWKAEKDSHVPQFQIFVKKEKGRKIKMIKSFIPFEGSSRHYTEHVILLDHLGKEMKKISFDPATKAVNADFTIRYDYPSKLYLISKCNLHDSWIAVVDPQSVK